MLNTIDRFLNNITMYRLVLYGLALLAAYSMALALSGSLSFGVFSYVATLLAVLAGCGISNVILSKCFGAPVNIESWLITGFILYFILFPSYQVADLITAFAVGFFAMASKYLLATNARHIFNPVAAGLFIMSIFPTLQNGNGVWWVGTSVMLPLVLMVGLLIVRKIRKFAMFGAFVASALVVTAVFHWSEVGVALREQFLSWPLIFFGTIMLTEPLTMPSRRTFQVVFGVIVGALFASSYSFGPIHSSPELALLIGNIFAYTVSMKRRLMLKLKEKKLISKETYEFTFTSDAPFTFTPGQYIEWTLSEARAKTAPDNRGNRRYFTIASSPTEKELKLGVKFYTPSSTFKQHLLNMKEGEMIAAGQLGGDFVMPKDTSKKLVFIAGGIGVTPFRSMVKYLSDSGEQRKVTLIYSVKEEAEIAYKDIFEEGAQKFGLRTECLIKDFLTKEVVEKMVPDWKDCMFYLSGPNAMVENYKTMLLRMGLPRASIKTDYFPGF